MKGSAKQRKGMGMSMLSSETEWCATDGDQPGACAVEGSKRRGGDVAKRYMNEDREGGQMLRHLRMNGRGAEA